MDKGYVGTIATFFVVKTKGYDDHNYSYWKDYSFWKAAATAYEFIPNKEATISERNVKVTSEGRVIYDDKVVWEDGVWLLEYDPRAKDPEWKDYIRLKKKFEEESKF